MREDVESASDRIMLWYHGLAPQDRQTIDPNGSVVHLLERRRELTSRLANVDRELAATIAEQLKAAPPGLRPPIHEIIIALSAAIDQLIASGRPHDDAAERFAQAIGNAGDYAVEHLGYQSDFAVNMMALALRRIMDSRVAAGGRPQAPTVEPAPAPRRS